MRMPDSEYNNYLHIIRDYTGSKEALQAMYDEICMKYDDGKDLLYRLDQYQSKYVMNLHR